MRDPLHWLSVRSKLALTFGLVCLLVFGVGGTLVSQSASRMLRSEIRKRLQSQCQIHASALSGHLHVLLHRLRDFASDGYIRDTLDARGGSGKPNDLALRSHLRENKLPLVREFQDLVVLNSTGEVETGVELAVEEYPSRFSAWSPPPATTAFSPFVAKTENASPSFYLGVPVQSREGQRPVGTILARVHAGLFMVEALRASRELRSAEDDTSLAIVDSSGQHLSISSSLLANHYLDDDSPLPLAGFGLELTPTDVPRGSPEAFLSSATDSVAVFLPVDQASGWSVRVGMDTRRAYQEVDLLLNRFLALGLALAAVVGLVLYFPMRYVAQPLGELSLASGRIASGDLQARVEVRSHDELGQLGDSFNRMVEALEERNHRLEATALELRQHGQELKHQRDQLDAVLHSMRDPLMVFDREGKVVLHNAAARELLPLFQSDEAPFRSHHVCLDAQASEQRCRSCFVDLRLESRSCVVDVDERTFEVHATTLGASQPGQESGKVVLARDISDRVFRDEQQIHQERLAVLGEVAAVMAHELNNPLTAINMFNQMMEKSLPADSPLRENVELIQRNTLTCRRTIRELLSYATGSNPETTAVDLHETLQDVARFLRPLAKRAGVQIEWQLEPHPRDVHGDEIQLRQIFVNLLMNGLQAMGERGGTLQVATQLDDEAMRVDITDGGPGIPAEVRSRIFRPFFTTKPRGVGTGLGLSTARRIAEMHGGSLELEASQPGQTVFRVLLRCRSSSPRLPLHPAVESQS